MATQDWLTKDLYEVLGVCDTSDEDTIRRAYRVAARHVHPDLNGGCAESEQQYKELSAAYWVLSDRRRRAAYDRTRGTVTTRRVDVPSTDPGPGGFAPYGGWAPLWWAPAAWSVRMWSSWTVGAVPSRPSSPTWPPLH